MNDPRITAYALGELTGREREEFERELAASEALQQELTETIRIADAIGNLPASGEAFSGEMRQALSRQCAENRATTQLRVRTRKFAIHTGALAATIAVLLGVFALILSSAGYLQRKASQTGDVSRSPRPRDVLPPPPELLETPSVPDLVSSPQTVIVTAPAVADPGNGETKAAKLAEELNQRIDLTIAAAAAEKSLLAGSETRAISPPVLATDAGAERENPNQKALAKIAPEAAAPAAGERMSVATVNRMEAFTEVWGRGTGTETGMRTRESEPPVRRGAPDGDFSTETYDAIAENVFLTARENPLSTFSIDVDTASYSNVRRFLQDDQRPPAGAIRTEELLNYFPYSYPQPAGDAPFSVNIEVSRAPWDAQRELVRIGLKGREIPASERGPANLVFLLDVSGSMDHPDKLPLLKRSLAALVENLSARDRVAIVVYAGSSGLVLPSTLGADKAEILEALDNLKAGGSTNGGQGIRLAYKTAREHFLKGGNNRVILCTDGDFNVGTTSQSELGKLIEKERASGVFLSVLGFGTGNLKDSTMEKLADKGNGNYAYIDSLTEGRKVLVEQMGATLFTIAKDVKIQVEFNPARVAGYRLIGYENRLLAKEDFNDDKKDAGEIGAGHAVTALYEIIPAGQSLPDQPSVDPLKYQPTGESNPKAEFERRESTELLTLKLRYKAPDGDTSRLLEVPLNARTVPDFAKATSDFQFAAAVAAFGMKMRGSPAAGDLGWNEIKNIVRRNLGEDPGSYRAEFLTLIEKASRLQAGGEGAEE